MCWSIGVLQRGNSTVTECETREEWEAELHHEARVGGFEERVETIHEKLKLLWDEAQPLSRNQTQG